MGSRWTLDDIPWHRFDPDAVDPGVLAMVKAAAMVEANAADYVDYLHRVFSDDDTLKAAISLWGEEEAQHGAALGRWAELADPSFSFSDSLARFRENFRIPAGLDGSVRGSRSGELIARCVVECGTSSFYSAIRDDTDEPVLRAICHRIAGDEFRHYKLFRQQYRRYSERHPLSALERVKVAAGRIFEAEDEELALAWYCSNQPKEPFDRRRHSAAYGTRAVRVYRFEHVARALRMIFKACGFNAQGQAVIWSARLAWGGLRLRGWWLHRYAT